MATRTNCLPWWHNKFAPLSTGYGRPIIRSGCSIVGGNVNCRPEDMRTNAEAEMRRLGYWSKGQMPLAVYTLGRYASSEVGGGTPEEKVAIMEAAINRARMWYPAYNVNQLLLYHPLARSSTHPNYGWYGPIHAGAAAPYQRWASTNQDPGIDDLLIADFVLRGQSDNFARDAVDQIGPDLHEKLYGVGSTARTMRQRANKNEYWVGPLPGVNHWHTFLYFKDKSIASTSPQGQSLINRAAKALSSGPPDWSTLPVCRKPFLKPVLFAGAGLMFAGLLWWGLSRTKKIPKRYHIPWMGDE